MSLIPLRADPKKGQVALPFKYCNISVCLCLLHETEEKFWKHKKKVLSGLDLRLKYCLRIAESAHCMQSSAGCNTAMRTYSQACQTRQISAQSNMVWWYFQIKMYQIRKFDYKTMLVLHVFYYSFEGRGKLLAETSVADPDQDPRSRILNPKPIFLRASWQILGKSSIILWKLAQNFFLSISKKYNFVKFWLQKKVWQQNG
jgi:hypothetical protein